VSAGARHAAGSKAAVNDTTAAMAQANKAQQAPAGNPTAPGRRKWINTKPTGEHQHGQPMLYSSA
jgi:hypothetical protein